LLCMMMLTVVDVVMRYGFNDSLRGAFEITELLLALLMFSGFPLVTMRNQHVVVELIDRLISRRARRVLDACAQIVCMLVFAGIAWLMWRKAGRVAAANDVTAVLQITVLPFVYAMFVLAIATSLIHLWQFTRIVRGEEASVTGSVAPAPPT